MTTNKDQLLKYLKEKRGNWISGESVSNKLSVSRSAIWKQIKKLREEGYVIESSPKKGYLLSKSSNLLFADDIPGGLDTKVFGKKGIHYFREIGSTNTKAKDLAASGAPEGTIIIAEQQTEGRGRRGRVWFSPPGKGIYISLILRPEMPPSEAPTMTLMTAIAVAEALISLVKLEVSIKWPNDILVRGKKIAGILTEISTEMDSIDFIIVGLGMNVNIPFESFPKEINDIVTSILIETGKHFSRIELIRAYLHFHEKYYKIFQKSGYEPIIERWKGLSDMIGQHLMVNVLGKEYSGEVIDMDNDGALILKDNQGGLHRIFSGDVTILQRSGT
ncbi:MAG: biotin--[acetyl-CoA-carboxylase] ligase [Desulfobacterales bacterium]|nr:biotin--[acetyl-CoA-carboxylase] ligase [Desulfobacterales bacterium]